MEKFNKLSYISFEKPATETLAGKSSFPLSSSGRSAPLCISSKDYAGIGRIAKLFQTDIKNVTGAEPELCIDRTPDSKKLARQGSNGGIVLIGTLGKSELIDKLVREKKIDISQIKDKWEMFLVQVVKNPLPDVDSALVVVGSNKRGTIFGMFDISEQIGVSPLYWWADVPIKKHSEVFVLPGKHIHEEPRVKYRGIFINDEAPAFDGWCREKFGGVNHKAYEKVLSCSHCPGGGSTGRRRRRRKARRGFRT